MRLCAIHTADVARSRGPIREFVEYAAAWSALKSLGILPRRTALDLGKLVGLAAYRLAGGLKRSGRRNLEIAFPEMPSAERERILRAAFLNAGRQLGEFSQMPKLRTAEDAHRTVRFEGREMVMDTLAEGRGALFLTGHFGAWELSPYCLRLTGSPPVNFLVRRIDNPRVEALADRYRTLCGNRTIDKSKAARPVLAALARGEMVGILADLNTLEHEGVFVNFFGVPASTTAGLAVIALKTGAPVIPVHTRWEREGKTLRPDVRARTRAHPHRLTRRGCALEHAGLHGHHRALDSRRPGPVDLGPSPLEDPSSWGSEHVLNQTPNAVRGRRSNSHIRI